MPTAAAWTFAALPNAISFALIGVVLAEFVGSTTGMGYLMMITALATLNATDMFAAVTLLSLVGIALCVRDVAGAAAAALGPGIPRMSGPTPGAARLPQGRRCGPAKPDPRGPVGASLRSNKHDVSSRFPFPAIGE